MKYPKRSQYKYAKSPYRIRNWPEYEAGLRRRGDLTVWLSDDAINSWRAPPSGKPGGQRTYANIAIQAALRKSPKHRAWRKLHLAVDAGSGEIVASDLTSRRTHDCARVPALLGQIDHRVASIAADGAYDTEGVYEAAHAHGEGQAVSVLIPPRRDAQLSPRPSAASMERNRTIRSIRRLGRREWHKRSGYSTRSMVENAIYRYKTIIGRGMKSRTLAGQRVEVQLACRVLNTMTRLGMPDSYRVG
jgi:hypothetical protein